VFIGLFTELLQRQLSESEGNLLRKFFEKYAPFEKDLTRSVLLLAATKKRGNPAM